VRALIGCADSKLAEKLVQALSDSGRVETVGVAATPAEAAEKAAALKPDVAVIDVNMGGELRGMDTGLALQRSGSSTGLVMISPTGDRGRLEEMPAGMGTEWSYLLAETAEEPGGLAYAAQCAAWSIPVVDPKVDRGRPAARPGRPEKSRTAPPAVPGAAKASNDHGSGWQGAVQTFSLPGADGPATFR